MDGEVVIAPLDNRGYANNMIIGPDGAIWLMMRRLFTKVKELIALKREDERNGSRPKQSRLLSHGSS